MNNIIRISAVAAISTIMLNGCIKEAIPTSVATQDQVTLETTIEGIPAALVQAGSTGYGLPWDFGLPAIHIATESMTGDLVISGNTGYDWFSQWGCNIALGSEYAVGALTWNNYYKWIMAANNVIKLIDTTDFTSLDETQKKYLGFAYTYRAMFYFDLTRLYEFKKNNYTEDDSVLGLGVPVVLPETTEAQAKNNPRATVFDIYDKIIFPDLDNAETLLSGYKASDKYSISLAVVYGMKARAFLERGSAFDDADDNANATKAYASAAEFARKAITASGCTPLTQSQWEDPVNCFNNAASNNAWMWALALPSESVSNLMCFTAHMSTENDWSAYGYDTGRAINRNLFNSINNHDFRKHSWLAPDRGYSYKSCREDGKAYFKESLKDYTNIKFRPAQGNYKEYKVGGAADHCLMRVEEMYFIEAEARSHIDLQEGIRLLNTFMNTYRMMDGVEYAQPKPSHSRDSRMN